MSASLNHIQAIGERLLGFSNPHLGSLTVGERREGGGFEVTSHLSIQRTAREIPAMKTSKNPWGARRERARLKYLLHPEKNTGVPAEEDLSWPLPPLCPLQSAGDQKLQPLSLGVGKRESEIVSRVRRAANHSILSHASFTPGPSLSTERGDDLSLSKSWTRHFNIGNEVICETQSDQRASCYLRMVKKNKNKNKNMELAWIHPKGKEKLAPESRFEGEVGCRGEGKISYTPVWLT